MEARGAKVLQAEKTGSGSAVMPANISLCTARKNLRTSSQAAVLSLPDPTTRSSNSDALALQKEVAVSPCRLPSLAATSLTRNT